MCIGNPGWYGAEFDARVVSNSCWSLEFTTASSLTELSAVTVSDVISSITTAGMPSLRQIMNYSVGCGVE
jgi:hypothetical protein